MFYDFAKNVFPTLMKNNEIMCGFKINDYWNDIGTLNQYKSSSFEILNGLTDFKMPYKESSQGWIAESASLCSNISVENKIIAGENTIIED